MSPPMISKAAARYTGAGGKEHCSLCRHFSPRRGGRCARVLGDISPMGWCKLFSREIRALIADVPFVAGGGGPVPALSLDFMTPGTLNPAITFTRASTATYFDAAGVMQTAAVNAPRWDYDPATLQLRGLLLEDQRTNGTRNSTMVGAVPGSPGTLPTNWVVGGSPAVVPQVVATGTENGIPYIDIRLSGTAASAQFQVTQDGGVGMVAALNGQVWTGSVYIRQIAGTLNGITNIQLLITEATTAGATIRSNFGPTITATSAPLASQRSSMTATLSGGGTVGAVYTRVQWNTTTSAAIEATFRIGAPQIELGDFATSYIPTTTVAVTRSIDSCLILPANMGWFTGTPGGSWFVEFDYFDATPTNSRVIGRSNVSGGITPVMLATGPPISGAQYDGAVALATTNVPAANASTKIVTTWTAGQAKVCTNGGTVASSAALSSGYAALTTLGVRFMAVTTANTTDNTSGHLRNVRYWPTVLTDAQMQAMTAP